MTDTAGLMHILQICDSLFPVGAFTLSNGLETYVQHDIITSPKGLEEYLHSYISVLPYNELGAAAAAYNADERSFAVLMRYTLRRKHHLRYEAAQKRSQGVFSKYATMVGKASQGFIKA